MRQHNRQLTVLATFASLLVLLATPVLAQSDEGNPLRADTGDSLAGRQTRLADRYDQLELLVGRLAELSRSTQPRRAQLLSELITKSRERDIAGRFDLIVDQLQSDQLGEASTAQQELQVDLKKLLALLEQEDRDRQIESERERIQKYLAELKHLIQLQRGIKARTDGGDEADKLTEDQQRLSDATQKLEGEIRATEGSQTKSDSQQTGENNSAEDENSPDGESSDKSEEQKSSGEKSDDSEQDGQGDPSSDNESADKPQENQQPSESEGKPSESQPSEGENSSPNSEQSPSDNQSQNEGQPQQGQPQEGQPQQGQPQQGQPQQGQPQQGQPQQGKPQQDQQPPSEQPQSPAERAQQRLRQAQQRMQQALEKLEEAQREQAVDRQQEALRELEQAKAELERILRQLREEERERMLVLLEARFRKMLDEQVAVYEQTKKLDGNRASSPEHEVEIASGRLSRLERQIVREADRALVLLREDGTTVAFPEAIEQARDDMQAVSERLLDVKLGVITQGLEEDIIMALEETLAALQQALEEAREQKSRPQNQQNQSGEPGEQDLVDRLAELRMIRALQNRINRRTERYGEILGDEFAVEPDLIEALNELARRQERVFEATRDLESGRNQ